MEWYVIVGDDRRGPVAETDLASMVTSGDLTPDSMVWNEDMDDWIAAKDSVALTSLLPDLKPKKAPPPPPRKQERKAPPPPPPPGGGASGFGSSGTSTSNVSDDGELHWLGKAGKMLGKGSGAKPEQLNPTTAVGRVQLEVFGACMVLIAIIAFGAFVSWMIQLANGSSGTGGEIIGIVINVILFGLTWMAGLNALKGQYTLAKVMFIIVLIFSGLAFLLLLLALATAPLLALFSLIVTGFQAFVAFIGFQRCGRLGSLQA